jgi:hypothetical protein
MRIKEPKVNIGIVQNRKDGKLSIDLREKDNFSTAKLEIDGKTRLLEEGENEIYISQDVESARIVVEPNYQGISEVTNTNFIPKEQDKKYLNIIVNKEVVNSMSGKILFVAPDKVPELIKYSDKKRNIQRVNKSHISESYLSLSNNNDLRVFFFIDTEQLFRENSYFSKITKNIKNIDKIKIKIDNITLLRQRVKENGEIFDLNQPYEEIVANFTQEDAFETGKIKLFTFVDETLKEKSFGLYHYGIKFGFKEPFAKYIESILNQLVNNIDELKQYKRDKREYELDSYISFLKEAEAIIYGQSTQSYINDEKSFQIFIEKYTSVYRDLNNFFKTIVYNVPITVEKWFKNFFDSDFVIKNEKIKKNDVIEEFVSRKVFIGIDNLKLNVNISEKEDNEKFFEKFSISTTNKEELLKRIEKFSDIQYKFELLDGFQDGVCGEVWRQVTEDNIDSFTRPKYFCKFSTNSAKFYYNKYFIVLGGRHAR